MNNQFIWPLLAGILLIVLGYFMSAKESVAAWGLRTGRARIWVTLLGQERAMKLTRYFFGPLVILMGLLCLVVAFASRK